MNTNLIDRYLNTIRFWLPDDQPADDIIAEIREDLMSQIDGRELNDDELAALLKRRGEPSFVASQFGKHKPLIGSEWMPAYWFVLRLVTLRILVPVFCLIIGPIEWLQAPVHANFITFCLRQIWSLLVAQALAAGIITAIFAMLDRLQIQIHWDPRKLPNMPIGRAKVYTGRTRSSIVADLVAGAIATCVWVAVLRSPDMATWTIGSVRLSIAPVLFQYLWPFLILSLFGLALNWFLLAWPMRLSWGPWLRVALDAANLAVLCMLLAHGPPWIECNVPAYEESINLSMTIGFIAAIAISAWETMARIRANMRAMVIA